MRSHFCAPFLRAPLLALLLALTAAHANAHHVWIEQDAQGAKLYFGEFGENLREASPGLLDKFGKPAAQKISAKGAEPLDISKTPTGFALASRAAAGESLVVEDAAYPSFAVRMADKPGARGIYVPAARLVTSLAKHEPKLTLDLVPTGPATQGSLELQAFYKGQPLPKAKVEVITASGWGKEHHTDAEGKIRITMPWQGTYVLEMSYSDTAGGERGGERYERASYVTSLTLQQAEGLPALPAPPAATPNKAN